MSDERRRVKISQQLEINSNHFIIYFNQLIEIFDGRIKDKSYDDLCNIWYKVQRIFDKSKIEIVEYIAPHFLKFKNDIKNENVDDMLKYDYSQEIVDDCIPETRKLILALVDNIKYVYTHSDKDVQQQIVIVTKKITERSIADQKLRDLMKKI